MSLFVQKYGGTSVASAAHIENIAKKIKGYRDQGHDVVVVVSAMSGETNRLLDLAHEITLQPPARELDVLVATGEQVTISLLAMALEKIQCKARSFTGAQVAITTDHHHNKARISSIDTRKILKEIAKDRVVVVAGFQGVNDDGDITTLGRGGSDTTAVALAAATKADECQIYTDVDGVYTTDPRVVPEARKLDVLTYEEMLEMAGLGAKVLQIRSVEFASKYKVRLRVLSSFDVGEGTLITSEEEVMEQAQISGIAFNRDEAKLTIVGIPDQPGVAHQILGPIADGNIEVDMIIQNVAADATNDFTFTVHRSDYSKALNILKVIAKKLGARDVSGDDKIIKISLIGVGMRSHAGIASAMFETLAAEGINIKMISTSEIKISVVVDEKYLELGVRALHQAFGLEQKIDT